MSSWGISGEPPHLEAPPAPPRAGRWRGYLLALGFLAPALFFLGVWIVYPTISTVVRSFYDRSGDAFVGFDNYEKLFTTDVLVTAIKNNFLWVLVVPASVTAFGIVFAVLTERVGWAVAFKTAVFMPMAVSAFAAGITWRIMYVQDPNRGVVNAGVEAVRDVFVEPGTLSTARPSTDELEGSVAGGFFAKQSVQPGQTVELGLTAVRAPEIPSSAEQAVQPEPLQGGITGVVWRDFAPGGGGAPGVVDEGEVGLPNVTVELRGPGQGGVTTRTAPDGSFAFDDLEPGSYRVGVAPATFAQPFRGVSWLGPKLITPAIMIAYMWIWAGFAMVVIAAGLAAIPRDVLEAARTDGATEWQVFRRVTVPLLAPVLSVVFITMLINVLKVFDIVIAIAPGSVQDDASVLALAMWRTAFSGANDFGLGSAIAVFIFVLVIPILLLNVRRFRREI
jgi:alpha-glucoside transport system permease protein